MNELGLSIEVTPTEIAREKSLGGAIELCAKAASLDPKDVMDALRVDGRALDKGQWSRWKSGDEGVVWPKFKALMNFCGNDSPVLWMLHDRGYDLHSIRRVESEVEKENRLLREENIALRRVLTGAMP